jgi:predicted nucleic acid-binding protein
VIVADSSAVVEVLLNTPSGLEIRRRFELEEAIHVPHLLDLEVLQVLRRYARTSILDDQRVAEALQDFEDLPLRRHSHRVLLPRIWELRHNLTAYDAAYLALAEILDAPLITRDRAFASIKGHRARVLVL